MASIASDSLSLPINDDLFSMFPDDILYQILYVLTLRQRAIASLVSRKWYHMIKSFNDHYIIQKHSTKYVTKHAADKSVMEFYMLDAPDKTCRGFRFLDSDLTQTSVESRLLAVLHINGCLIVEKYFFDIKELSSLKEICFSSILLPPVTFSKIINKCPSIVEITLKKCSSLYYLTVPHLNRLKKVHVSGCYVREIKIKSRNLEEFHLFSSSLSRMRVDFRACTKLQVLKMDCNYKLKVLPEDICRVFPCLKSLFLRLRPGLNKLKLSSTELENLGLSNMVDLQDAIISTPSLRTLELLDMKNLPRLVVGSTITEVEIGLKKFRNHMKPDRLLDLRTFLENLGENISLSLETNSLESKEVRSNTLPLRIKHINLQIVSGGEAPRYESLIEELFSYFHPQTVLVRVSSKAMKHNFIQVLLDGLKPWESECDLDELKRWECDKCCSGIDYMCWRCCLKGFKILESTTNTGQEAHKNINLEFQW